MPLHHVVSSLHHAKNLSKQLAMDFANIIGSKNLQNRIKVPHQVNFDHQFHIVSAIKQQAETI